MTFVTTVPIAPFCLIAGQFMLVLPALPPGGFEFAAPQPSSLQRESARCQYFKKGKVGRDSLDGIALLEWGGAFLQAD